MGKIYGHKGSPIPLLRAIAKINTIDVQYIHIGTIDKEVLEEIQNMQLPFFQYWGYKTHQEAINFAAGADISILINNNDIESTGVLTGKIFELIKIGKPILAVGPRHGLVRDLLEKTNSGAYAFIEDEEAILAAISKLLTGNMKRVNMDVIDSFSRKRLTQRLIEVYQHGV
jgi:hypothetical protein